MIDPLSAAIEAAVDRAVQTQLPKIIAAFSASQRPAPPPLVEPDRFVRIAEVARLLGVHRTTLHRMTHAGKLPPMRRLGSASGYLLSEVRAIQGDMSTGEADPERSRKARAAVVARDAKRAA